MSLTRHIPRLAAALAFFLSVAAWTPSHGAVIITATETAGNVVFSFTGSVILTGLTGGPDSGPVPAELVPTAGYFSNYGSSGAYSQDEYSATITGTAFGTGGPTGIASSSGGSRLVFSGSSIIFDVGYTSGAPLSGSMTFNSETFTTLGVTPGSYVYEIKDGSNNVVDTITMNIGAGAVPEPSRALLAGLGLGGLLLRRRRAAKA